MHKSPVLPVPCIFSKFDDDDDAIQPLELFLGPYHVQRAGSHRPQNTLLDQALITAGKSLPELEKTIKRLALSKGKQCYEAVDAEVFPNDSEFVKVMVKDGCFVLQLLYILAECHPLSALRRSFAKSKDPYNINVSRLRKWMVDLLMIKNQIPMEILRELHKQINYEKSLEVLLNNYFFCLRLAEKDPSPQPVQSANNDVHLLDIARRKILSGMMMKHARQMSRTTDSSPTENGYGMDWKRLRIYKLNVDTDLEKGNHFGGMSLWYSATDLHDAGFKIRLSSSMVFLSLQPWLLTFFFPHVLKLPRLLINKDSALIFNNVVAFEQRLVNNNDGNNLTLMQPISSYLRLLKDMIRTTEDVKTLSSRGILVNDLGNYEEVVEFFRSGLKLGDRPLEMDALSEIRSKINQHCQSKAVSLLADLRRTHFNSPWSAISCIYAFVLLILTVAQVVFAVLPYYQGRH